VSGLLDAVVDTWHAGGFVMPWLVACTVVLWFAIGERAWTLRRGMAAPVEVLATSTRVGGGVLGSALAAARAVSADRRTPSRLDEALAPIREKADRHRVLILTIAAIAPLIGLLGTVTGMIETFNALTTLSLHSSTGGVAGGISEALVSTQMGLAVAIPALLVGRLLDGKQEALEDELGRLTERLATVREG
jgi:biopolymer transport protein ExbB